MLISKDHYIKNPNDIAPDYSESPGLSKNSKRLIMLGKVRHSTKELAKNFAIVRERNKTQLNG